jgi:hypothetical protein
MLLLFDKKYVLFDNCIMSIILQNIWKLKPNIFRIMQICKVDLQNTNKTVITKLLGKVLNVDIISAAEGMWYQMRREDHYEW